MVPVQPVPFREPVAAALSSRRHLGPTCRHHCSGPSPTWRLISEQPPLRAAPSPLIHRIPAPRFKRPRDETGTCWEFHVIARRVSAQGYAVRPGGLGSLPLMEQALTHALAALNPVPLSVLHGIVSDDWLATDQPHFDVSFPR